MTVTTASAPSLTTSANVGDGGAATGRRVATEAAARGVQSADDPIGALARASTPALAELGIDVTVLRSRPGFLVVRSAARSPRDAAWACAAVRGWLEALPSVCTCPSGSTTEPSCAVRGASSCTHILVWDASEVGRELPEQSRETRVVPRPSTPEDGSVVGPLAPGDVISPTVHAVDTAPSDGRGSWLARWPWARRRSWLLLVGLLAGTLGGVFAATHGRVSYSATAVLEVAGPSSTTALSNAQGATQLAVTYAALIPSDEALLRLVARELGTQPSVLARELAVQAESGTALVEVRLSATSPIEAVAGANDVARALGSGRVPGQAIAPGSMTLVSAARTASPSGTLHKYGIALGVLLGLVVGVGAVIVAERTDRRIDDVESLADAAGCRATRLPGGIPVGELARGLARAGIDAVSVLAILPHDRARASELAHGLAAQRGVGDAALLSRVDTGEPLAAANVLSPDTEGPTLLVVTRGERVSAVEDTASRLRRIGRDPVAAVLLYPLGSRARRGAGRPDPVAP